VQPLKATNKRARPGFELADIIRGHADTLRHKQQLSRQQLRTLDALASCRTSALGGHVNQCGNCGKEHISYNSCRNRHCPKCGGLHRLNWQQKRNEELLPVPYFHVVFTIDHALNPLIGWNEATIYGLLFEAAWQTVREFSQKTMQGETGMMGVLHTWGQTLQQHVHLHTVLIGGAMRADGRWRRVGKTNFLFPAEAFSAAFRDYFCKRLQALHGRLRFGGVCESWEDEEAFGEVVEGARSKRWEVFLKPVPMDVGQTAIDYLSRYINRVAISNHRILNVDGDGVRFSYKDYRAEGQVKEMRLTGEAFLARYVTHILPSGFVRCRYYGLWRRQGLKERLAGILAQLGEGAAREHAERQQASKYWHAAIYASIQERATHCPACGGSLQRIRDLSPPRKEKEVKA
jgi:hypothetical protein